MAQKKLKLLILSYYWPPAGGPGVQRWLKLANYLQQFGHQLTLITTQDPVAANYDQSLLKEVHPDIELIRTKARDPFKLYQSLRGKKGAPTTGAIGLTGKTSLAQKFFNYVRANFFIPDARKGWNHYALPEAIKCLQRNKYDAVITTGPPHSTHLMGLHLKKQWGLKWLADFRDPWVNIFYNQLFPRTSGTVKLDQALEDKVVKEADLLLTVSPGLKAEFADRAKQIELIYNGYDPADLPARNEEAQSYFSLCYTGNLKPNQNVGALWQAIAALRERKPDFKSLLRLEWVGNVDAGTQEALVKSGLDSITTYHGYQPHAAATEAMVKAGALLFIVPQTTDNALILTGKLFEYLGSASPLLSIGPPDGNAARIIEGTGRGKMIEYSDQKAMEARLLYLFESWQKRQRSPALSSEAVAEYTREGAARKLSQILEELCR